jgi:twitching motility protein PilT
VGVELNEILKIALKGGASDIHLKSGLPPMFRVDGALVPLKNGERLSQDDVANMTGQVMNPVQKQRFEETREVDLAYGIAGLGRFRVNAFQQRGSIGIVFRVIPFGVKTLDQLHLPKVIESIAMEHRGLVLVTGTTGSGKSTTLAAMIEHINANRTCHIMTIEDPIEFLIRDRRSIVNQREIGVDTLSFGSALRAALRQDPDVVLVGEMRDFHRRRDRPPGDEHPAHAGCHRDHQPHHLGLPAVPAEADPIAAGLDPEGRHLPAPGSARRRQGPCPRVGSPGLDRPRSRVHR